MEALDQRPVGQAVGPQMIGLGPVHGDEEFRARGGSHEQRPEEESRRGQNAKGAEGHSWSFFRISITCARTGGASGDAGYRSRMAW